MDDSYGSKFRESLKKSMDQPAGEFKALNRRTGALKTIPGAERRRNWAKSFWTSNREYIYVVLMGFLALIAGTAAWLAMDRMEGYFR